MTVDARELERLAVPGVYSAHQASRIAARAHTLDEDRVERAATVLLTLAGRPQAWPTLTDYEKEAWRYTARRVIAAYQEGAA